MSKKDIKNPRKTSSWSKSDKSGAPKWFNFSVEDYEREVLEKMAEFTGLSVGLFVKRAALSYAEKVMRKADEERRRREEPKSSGIDDGDSDGR